MSLTKKQIQSVIADPSTFYLYKDYNVTAKDMVQIVTEIIAKSGSMFLLPIIKVAKDLPADVLNDEVQTAIFTKCKDETFEIQQVVDMFKMYKIPVSAELINKLVRLDYTKYSHKSAVLVQTFQPKLEHSTIEHILKYKAVDGRIVNYVINQLIDAKEFKFITSQSKLFNYMTNHNTDLAKQIAKQLIMDHEFAHINEQENKHAVPWYDYILFTDELKDLMINECLATQTPSAIVTNKTTLQYIFNVTYADEKTNAKFAKFKQDIVRQLLDRKEYDVLTNNPRLLHYIIQEDTNGTLQQIPNMWYFNAIQHVDDNDALDFMNKMKLPNAELEYAYIKRFNNANTQFSKITELSPETIQYMRIIRDEMPASLYRGVSTRVISALINCHFHDRGDWYKIMENLLAANPHLDVQYIKQMLDKDANTEVLIKRYWKGDLNQIRKDKEIADFKAKHKILAGLFGMNKQNKK
ncbi:MAG: hypothetical protein IKP24_01585 [Alphaproteobacteria bacterium]|nr:hypothetical protein [Alphaproteobacteria bacterium]